MKILKMLSTALVITGLLTTPVASLAGNGPGGTGLRSGAGGGLTPLSEPEIATLKWMREEEKLARDIYIELNAFWPAKIFVNIAASEQNHFDALGKKLELYGISDPALPSVGVFRDPALQALHDELLAAGMISEVAALGVGVTIEETDIVDLDAAIEETSSRPLRQTYEHLLNGSENHLRSFLKVLDRVAPK
jgi:hypothetical protein